MTLQLLPPVVHPAGASGFVVTDTACYCEHVTGGYVYTEEQTATRLDILFDTLRAECRRASESVAIIRETQDSWTGANLRSRTQTEATA